MPWLKFDGFLIHFAHVPKTAGTSIDRYLEARFGQLNLWDRNWADEWVEWGHHSSSIRTSLQHITARDAERILPRKPDWSFSVVRNPVARMISEYQMQARSKRRRSVLTKAGFSVWLAVVTEAARHDATLFDNHIRPQNDIVPVGAEVFHLEDGLADLIARLDAVSGTSAPNLVLGHALANKSNKSIDVSQNDLARIFEFFGEDYNRFGFTPPGVDRISLRGLGATMLAKLCAPAIARRYGQGRL